MKSIKLTECKWEVKIESIYQFIDKSWAYHFIAYTKDQTGLNNPNLENLYYKTKWGAVRSWKKFAKLNGYKHYKIIK